MAGLILAARGRITTHHGEDIGRGFLHVGVDIGHGSGAGEDIIVRAPHDGVIIAAGRAGTYGNQLIVRRPDGWWSRLAHLADGTFYTEGTVTQGQHIATMGDTGGDWAVHLHQEFHRPDGTAVDPLEYLTATAGDMGTPTTETEEEEEMLKSIYFIADSNGPKVIVGRGDIWVRRDVGEPLQRLTARQAQEQFLLHGLDYDHPNVRSITGADLESAFDEDRIALEYSTTKSHPWLAQNGLTK